MFRRSVYYIISAMIFTSAYSAASTAPKCSAVLMFQKSEVEAKVTAIVKTILTYQMNSANGIQRDNAGFTEATRQINEITQNFPEMVKFYLAEMKRLSKKDSTVQRKIKRVADDQKVLDQKVQIEDTVVILEIEKTPHFIFKKIDGSYFVIGDNKEFLYFFSQQKDIQQVVSTKYNHEAIAILRNDGSVVTWGNKEWVGDSSNLDLTNVQSIYSVRFAFAALKNDGTVVVWGHKGSGGDSSHLDLTNVKRIYSNEFAFAALKNDGSVLTWGNKKWGGDSSDLDLTNVKGIYATNIAFSALKIDGSVISWGDTEYGGDSSHLKLSNVKEIYSNAYAFAALKNDGSVLTWGNKKWGGDSSHLDLTNVKRIYATNIAFSAHKIDDSVISWGDKEYVSNSSHLDLTKVKDIISNESASAAINIDGSVLTWGYKSNGGDSSPVQNQLYDIVHIIEIKTGSFLALRKDGKYVLWGQPIGKYQNQVLDFDLR